MEEFQEIAQAGGKITFSANGAPGYSFSKPLPVTIYFLAASFNGYIYGFVDAVGLGQKFQKPDPSILVFMVSDSHGMFGRKCPRCGLYHRANAFGDGLYCPYCNHHDSIVEFLTDNQKEYVSAYLHTFLEAWKKREEIEIDLDAIVAELKDNTYKFVYKEEKQQNQYSCKDCHGLSRDVVGEYSSCPACGKRNTYEIFSEKISKLQSQLDSAEQNDLLFKAVAHFDGMGSDIKTLLQYLPATSQRKRELSRLSFQRIMDAADSLLYWFGINLFKGIPDDDKEFVSLMFNRRHLIAHNAGVADKIYLNATNDHTVRERQLIRIDKKDNSRLLTILKSMSKNLVDGWESIS
ncbi:MAG: hypothetical protein ABIK12_03485 [Pseudomonadota bacterium]